MAIPVLFAVVFAIMLSCIPLYRRVQTKARRRDRCGAGESVRRARHPRLYPRTDRDGKLRGENRRSVFRAAVCRKLSALLNPLTYVIINLAIVAILRVGGVRVNEGAITQGQLIALYNYMSQILVELIKFANLILNITKSAACAGRISQVLDTKSSMVSGADALPDGAGERGTGIPARQLPLPAGRRGCADRYQLLCRARRDDWRDRRHRLRQIDAGKSDPRFYDATDGQVLVRGEDVKSLRLQALRTRIGVVPQKALLFSGTIRENLRWGNADASDEALWDALRAAQADGVVQDKKGQLDAEVEPGGRNFSGGQRQRLTIARALVRRPELLILDDSASALDFRDGRSAAQGAVEASVESPRSC